MDVLLFLLILTACVGAGATGAMFPPGRWYEKLNKPAWVPPNWVFPVAWTTIYLLMSFAASRVAMMPGAGYTMAFWAVQIAFNTLWTPVFFGLRRMKTALPIIGVLWLAVLGCTITHWQLDLWAGLAFLPYLAWVSVAAALNREMVRLNPDVAPLEMNKL